MSNDVLVVAEHLDGSLADITFELLDAGNRLAAELGGSCAVALVGGTRAMVAELGAASRVWQVDGPAHFEPESHAAAVGAVLDAAGPRVTLIGNTSMGMDLASAVAVRRELPLATSCLSVSGGAQVRAVANLYGGKMHVTIDLGAGACVATMLAGAGSAEAGRVPGSPAVQAVAAPGTAGRVRFVGLSRPEAADVDITTQEVLVAIGRGIGNADGVEVAEELAEALDAAVAASRPIIDAGWMPRSRQVGKSGLKVKPKVYLALGISGAPEHLEGIKGASTVIAVNTDAEAPIFRIADYGLVADLFDVCEELTDELG